MFVSRPVQVFTSPRFYSTLITHPQKKVHDEQSELDKQVTPSKVVLISVSHPRLPPSLTSAEGSPSSLDLLKRIREAFNKEIETKAWFNGHGAAPCHLWPRVSGKLLLLSF